MILVVGSYNLQRHWWNTCTFDVLQIRIDNLVQSSPFHQIKLFPFLLWQRCELTAGSDEKKKRNSAAPPSIESGSSDCRSDSLTTELRSHDRNCGGSVPSGAALCFFFAWSSSSPRMPHTLGEIFTHAQLLDFKNRNSWAGPGAAACSSINTCAASRDPISAASAVANCGWNYCWWINWQRRLESWSSSSSLQRGWSARMATRWSSHHPVGSIRYQSLHVSSSANGSFKKFTGARSRRPHHSHFLHGRQNRRSSFCRCCTVREEVRIWWQSRGL